MGDNRAGRVAGAASGQLRARSMLNMWRAGRGGGGGYRLKDPSHRSGWKLALGIGRGFASLKRCSSYASDDL